MDKLTIAGELGDNVAADSPAKRRRATRRLKNTAKAQKLTPNTSQGNTSGALSSNHQSKRFKDPKFHHLPDCDVTRYEIGTAAGNIPVWIHLLQNEGFGPNDIIFTYGGDSPKGNLKMSDITFNDDLNPEYWCYSRIHDYKGVSEDRSECYHKWAQWLLRCLNYAASKEDSSHMKAAQQKVMVGDEPHKETGQVIDTNLYDATPSKSHFNSYRSDDKTESEGGFASPSVKASSAPLEVQIKLLNEKVNELQDKIEHLSHKGKKHEEEIMELKEKCE